MKKKRTSHCPSGSVLHLPNSDPVTRGDHALSSVYRYCEDYESWRFMDGKNVKFSSSEIIHANKTVHVNSRVDCARRVCLNSHAALLC